LPIVAAARIEVFGERPFVDQGLDVLIELGVRRPSVRVERRDEIEVFADRPGCDRHIAPQVPRSHITCVRFADKLLRLERQGD
jgi:hypothetical protein